MNTPSSIQAVTVALNPALDQTIEVERLTVGEVNRALTMQVDVGGKGINVASCLADFGIRTAVTGLLGRENAAPFEALFQAKAIANQCFYLDGQTRINTKLVERASGETTDINLPGPALSADAIEAQLERLMTRLDGLAEHARWVVLAGSLPPGWPTDTYRRLIDHLHRRGARVALDASGAALASAIAAGPDIAKPNRDELAELVGHSLSSTTEVMEAARELLARTPGLRLLVVSMGADGALFISREESWLAHPAQVELISTVGAGDAMVAGIIAARIGELSLADSAKLATAFSAAKLARLGPHLPAVEEVITLAQSICLDRIA